MELGQLVSETRNPDTMGLDTLSTLEMVTCFNREDHKVAEAITEVLPQAAAAIDLAFAALSSGGRMIYLGAGTSGRLGVLDAVECPPTFGIPADRVIGLIAGGNDALFRAVEGAEDNSELGKADLLSQQLASNDIVVGIAASGRTPYVIGGLQYARSIGCKTVAISCNPSSPIGECADVTIAPVVGPEALTGSTRMKSGTAQKLILNMLSTGTMVKLGKVYQNLMVDVKATNEKLVDRACRIVVAATGISEEEARQLLSQTDYEAKPAILMALTGLTVEQAKARLVAHAGYLRAALENEKRS